MFCLTYMQNFNRLIFIQLRALMQLFSYKFSIRFHALIDLTSVNSISFNWLMSWHYFLVCWKVLCNIPDQISFTNIDVLIKHLMWNNRVSLNKHLPSPINCCHGHHMVAIFLKLDYSTNCHQEETLSAFYFFKFHSFVDENAISFNQSTHLYVKQKKCSVT